MKVLIIGYVWPEPKSSAAGMHICAIMQAFVSTGWQVEFASPAQKTPHMIDLNSIGVSHSEIKLNCDSFNHYIQSMEPDVVMFDRFMMEEQFGWRVDSFCPNAIKILDTEDLQTVRNARHQAHKQKRTLSRADYLSDLAKREIASIYRCDLSLIISDFEINILKETFNIPSDLLHHLPFMVDIQSLIAGPSFNKRQHFVTIGNFRHEPNWDSVLWLHSFWPQIRKQLPDAELHIYGSYPPPKATALNDDKQGFLIKGWCNDAFDVIRQARVLLSPLRFGAGIKGKFLDAMICQTPSITTDIGIEGMSCKKSWPGIVVNTDDEIIQAALLLYTNQVIWQTESNKCHELVKQKFEQFSHRLALISRVEALKESLSLHRLNNFTGAMLKHHNHASTKYMSQWITEKNKHNKK